MKKLVSLLLALMIIIGLCPIQLATATSNIDFAYLGTDTQTKNHWEGKYGNEGYALLGYLYREENGENSLSELARPYIPLNSYDLIGGNAIKKLTVTNDDGLLSVTGKTECQADYLMNEVARL